MEKFFLKNWGIFYERLKKEHDELREQRKASKDPFEQWELEEKISFLNDAMMEYIQYLKSIKEDAGMRYMRYLENKYQLFSESLSTREDFEQKVCHEIASFMGKIKREFSVFKRER